MRERYKASNIIYNDSSNRLTSSLVYLLQPFYNSFNKRIVKTPKLYFMDTGLVNFLTGWYTAQQCVLNKNIHSTKKSFYGYPDFVCKDFV
ncbi:MAG: DUF4143 domain-containing protein [Ruminiclostridium sp.]|nr:DUF4143 domain-containing protein [Ruminiclostridium sp.]